MQLTPHRDCFSDSISTALLSPTASTDESENPVLPKELLITIFTSPEFYLASSYNASALLSRNWRILSHSPELPKYKALTQKHPQITIRFPGISLLDFTPLYAFFANRDSICFYDLKRKKTIKTLMCEKIETLHTVIRHKKNSNLALERVLFAAQGTLNIYQKTSDSFELSARFDGKTQDEQNEFLRPETSGYKYSFDASTATFISLDCESGVMKYVRLDLDKEIELHQNTTQDVLTANHRCYTISSDGENSFLNMMRDDVVVEQKKLNFKPQKFLGNSRYLLCLDDKHAIHCFNSLDLSPIKMVDLDAVPNVIGLKENFCVLDLPKKVVIYSIDSNQMKEIPREGNPIHYSSLCREILTIVPMMQPKVEVWNWISGQKIAEHFFDSLPSLVKVKWNSDEKGFMMSVATEKDLVIFNHS